METEDTIYKFILDITSFKIKPDIKRIEEIVFLAEDTGFTIKQCIIVSPWLLNFAGENRNNKKCNENAVYSAIRTGASMLSPKSADCLISLLDLNQNIEVVQVTTKMIRRIFEAFPQYESDQYKDIANEIYWNARLLLKKDIKEISLTEEVIVKLSIEALDLMKSSKYEDILNRLNNSKLETIKRILKRKKKD